MLHAFLDRLAHKGVSGKMWRLIDALYDAHMVAFATLLPAPA
jgi:hypothetical protein